MTCLTSYNRLKITNNIVPHTPPKPDIIMVIMFIGTFMPGIMLTITRLNHPRTKCANILITTFTDVLTILKLPNAKMTNIAIANNVVIIFHNLLFQCFILININFFVCKKRYIPS